MTDITSITDVLKDPQLTRNFSEEAVSMIDEDIDFVAANTPKGMIPGWELRDRFEEKEGEEVRYVYVREKRKKGGHKENITGDENFDVLDSGERAVLFEMEEEDNDFVEKVTRSAEILRKNGYKVDSAVTFLKKPSRVKERLEKEGLTLVEGSDLAGNQENKVDLKEPSYSEMNEKEVIRMIVKSGALDIRDLEGGEDPFLYSSGLWGPGYLMVKGLVSQPHVMKKFCWNLALKIQDKDFDFVIGNVTGGVIPGWQLRNYLEVLRGEEVPYIYAEGTRLLEDGLVEGELVGDEENPSVHKGDKALVVEELVNTAGTTTGSVMHARDEGYKVDHAATLFEYKNPMAEERLEEHDINLHSLANLPDTLELAEKEELFKPRAIEDYRFFMDNPKDYQDKWDLEPVTGGGTK